MLEKVVVKTEETKIFTGLIKCLIAGCLWTCLFPFTSITDYILILKLLPCCLVFWVDLF